MDKIVSTKELKNLMSRPEHGAELRFIESPRRNQLRDSISLRPEDIYQAVHKLGGVLEVLPDGYLGPEQRREYRSQGFMGLGTTLLQYAQVLKSEEIAGYTPEMFLDLNKRLTAYTLIRDKAAEGMNAVLDVRLLLGAIQWQALHVITKEVVFQMESPKNTALDDARLRGRFSRLLLHKHSILLSREERRKRMADKRAQVEEEIAEIDKRTLVEDTMEAIRQGRPVDPDTVKKAALYNREFKARKSETSEPIIKPKAKAKATDDRQSRR